MRISQDQTSEINFYKVNKDPLYYDKAIEERVVKLADFSLGSLILDAACGDGYWGRVFTSRGCRTIGLDISTDSLVRVRARSLAGQEFVVGNLLERLLFPKEYFDGIVCGGILHHLPSVSDIEIVLNNLSPCLKRNGKLIIVEPNGSNPIMKISRFLGRFLVKIYPFVATANETVHTVKAYKTTFGSCNFRVIVSEQYRHDPNGKMKIHNLFSFMTESRRKLFDLSWRILPPEFGGKSK